MANDPVVTNQGGRSIWSPSNTASGQQQDQEGSRKCPRELCRGAEQLYRLAQTQCQEKATPPAFASRLRHWAHPTSTKQLKLPV